jgi:hypothetical protein
MHRNGAEGLRLAQQAHGRGPAWGRWHTLMALAEAFAELGRFSDAIHYAKEAAELVRESPFLRDQYQSRLEAFRSSRPYRMPTVWKKGGSSK